MLRRTIRRLILWALGADPPQHVVICITDTLTLSDDDNRPLVGFGSQAPYNNRVN